ncbi:MAG: hypothetical protein AAF086_09590 [Planctomycetota bacterium]
MEWAAIEGRGETWQPVRRLTQACDGGPSYGEFETVRPLVRSRLPAMMEAALKKAPEVRFIGDNSEPVQADAHKLDEAWAWEHLLCDGQPMTLPAGWRGDVILDLRDYVCAYPLLALAGGRDAVIKLEWAEALYTDDAPNSNAKAHRDQVEGLYFRGKGDRFIADGRAHRFGALHWRCGRHVRVRIRAAEEPLTITALRLFETRYPMETRPLPELSDTRLQSALPMMPRAVMVSTHETFSDASYYEQLIYVGDSRLEALVMLARSGDDRMLRRAIELYGWSLTPLGLTQGAVP